MLFMSCAGRIHCWDLRTDTEAWVLQVSEPLIPVAGESVNHGAAGTKLVACRLVYISSQVPVELGFLTSMAVGTERQSWLCAGTNRGYILLWDLRFQLLVKVSIIP